VSGKVYFIGAGPGDPDLLTRKAWKILSAAEIVLHDALVAPEIVRLAPPGAIIRNVGKRCGRKSITQEELHELMIGYASAGRAVIRLQGGDPLIFGRAGEEIAGLQEAGIDFEIIPGVTAAFAAAAAAQISLTRRKLASKVVFLSAHRHAEEAGDNWESLPASGATLAIYMPGSNYEEIARNLRAAGVSAETPCVIVSQASTDRQRIIRTDVASLGRTGLASSAQALEAPALLIVGEVTRVETQELVAILGSTNAHVR
jgi:uroporphyrin-III C-methyltransferase